MPAKAGTQRNEIRNWIPACAGMTTLFASGAFFKEQNMTLDALDRALEQELEA